MLGDSTVEPAELGQTPARSLAQAALGLLLQMVGNEPQEQVAARPLGSGSATGTLPAGSEFRSAQGRQLGDRIGHACRHELNLTGHLGFGIPGPDPRPSRK